ncbi:aminopeptidase N-like [Nomia melanderi]|uniref:aminopeptidase N-like n=1 Tax=Nomia melanderi TaxID=2448451 RepID=UPI003FCE7499
MEKNYPSSNYRLPKLFSPIKYNVFLSPYFEERNFTFFGKVEIEMKRLQLTSRIVVNSKNLNVKEVKVYVSKGNLAKGEQLELSAFYLNKETEMLTIFMKKFIKETNIIVEIDYTGQLNDDMEGFYRSHYRDSQGNIHWLATTQFQATYARNAFPCFDEPAFKASFIINIEKPDTYTALSNMPSAKSWESNVTGRVWETFTETPKMSSYVVAFVVFDFKPVRDAGTKVNVWSRPDMALNGDYAQIAAQRMLEFLEEKTNQSYVLPKLDLVAVPDFSMGAMENWGLATFREYGIHYNQVATTAKFVDYITTIIAHELTHMWFGNLVTCEWWENLWLNEGFAEYLQWTVSHSFRPSHGYNDLFVVDELQPAMLEDDYKSSHPMNKPVNTPSEIEDIFDGITYGKSSSVLRMLHNSFGPDVFFRAIHKYLSEHKYGNTRPKDLWKAFDDTIKELGTPGDWRTVENLMDNWTNKPGYPVVTVTLSSNRIEIQQNIFSFHNRLITTDYYWIPITVATSSKPDFTTTWTNIWLGPQSKTIYLDESEDWVLVNVQQSGFYRVQYSYELRKRLIKALSTINYGGIHVTNRAQIVDDSLNLARAGCNHVICISYWEVFEYVTYLKSEKEYLPWKAFFNGISYLLQRSDGHLAYDPLKAYIRYLASNMYKSLGFVDDESDNHQRLLSRELILTWMCKLGHEECVHEAKQQFDTFKMDVSLGRPNNISLNARAAVYCTAMKNATVDDWNFLWDRYLAASFSSEEKTILEALGCTTDTNLLRRYIMRALNISLTPDIRKQDVDAALASIYKSSRIGLDVMLDFLIDNFEKVYKYYGEWDSVGTLFSKVVSRISTVQQLVKIKIFMQSRRESLKNISSKLNKAVASAEEKYDWYMMKEPTITSYLTSRQWNEEKNSGTIPNTFSVVSITIFTIFAYMLS